MSFKYIYEIPVDYKTRTGIRCDWLIKFMRSYTNANGDGKQVLMDLFEESWGTFAKERLKLCDTYGYLTLYSKKTHEHESSVIVFGVDYAWAFFVKSNTALGKIQDFSINKNKVTMIIDESNITYFNSRFKSFNVDMFSFMVQAESRQQYELYGTVKEYIRIPSTMISPVL